jgi:hypothetical protein
MFCRKTGACTLLLLAAAALLAGCGRPPGRPGAQVLPTQPVASLAALDNGADILVDVDNAGAAIADNDAMAADNDVIQAGAFAIGLPDLASTPRQGEATALTAFEAEVALTTAQSKLERGDLAGADAVLAAIQQRAPTHLAAVDMPLLRADQSLGLARLAIASEYPAQLRTQLTIAETSLDAYQGGPHAADAKTLAGTIDRLLKQPDSLRRLQADQLAAWSGRVDDWG